MQASSALAGGLYDLQVASTRVIAQLSSVTTQTVVVRLQDLRRADLRQPSWSSVFSAFGWLRTAYEV